MSNRMWGGRFAQEPDTIMEEINASIDFDKALATQDIAGSKAHARMLADQGIITSQDASKIIAGLDTIASEISEGKFTFSRALEDIHMNIEARLKEIVGEPAGRLHTGRSRNDQVATDIRLYLREEITHCLAQIREFQKGLLDIADQEADTIMPGFTHLQVAQPITFGHHMLAWFEMLDRDHSRFKDCARRMNVMPLGAAALAGTSYQLDRDYTAELLAFDAPSRNSLDAVSDRDFAIEFCASAAICMTHLSRMAEELVIWSTTQFNFIQLPDRYCTGSSIMPQKKNPDVPELVRGKTGRVIGHLVSLLTLMKSQPLAYNKDNQEDKEPLFDVLDTLGACLRAFSDIVPNLSVNREAMYAAAKQGYATATDLADYLVNKGLPFRDAHEVVGGAVAYAIEKGKDLSEFTLQEMHAFDRRIEADVFDILSLEGSVAAREVFGGTAPKQVRRQIADCRKLIKK